MKLTAKETAVLRALDINEYGDYITDPVWTWAVTDYAVGSCGITEKSMGGIVNSLVKKGAVVISADSEPVEDRCIEMTEAGALAYIAAVGEATKEMYQPDDADQGEPVAEVDTSTEGRRAGAVQAVWDICDANADARRKDVVAKCVAKGLNIHTAKTQYQKWFSYNK